MEETKTPDSNHPQQNPAPPQPQTPTSQPQPQTPNPLQPQVPNRPHQTPNPPRQAPEYQQPQIPNHQPQPQAPTHQKSPIIAGLLGIFLGATGAHFFYLGNTHKSEQRLIILMACLGITIIGFFTLGLPGIFIIITIGFAEGISLIITRPNSISDPKYCSLRNGLLTIIIEIIVIFSYVSRISNANPHSQEPNLIDLSYFFFIFPVCAIICAIVNITSIKIYRDFRWLHSIALTPSIALALYYLLFLVKYILHLISN